MKKVLYSLALLSLFVALIFLISCPGTEPKPDPIVLHPTIQLISPDNLEIFNGPQKVTLEWEHDYELLSSDNVYYRVYLDTANSFPNGRLGISDTKSYDTDALKEDVYYWKVVLHDEDRGGEQYESITSSFTIQSLDNTPQLISPADGEIFIGPQEITLEWEHEYELGTTDAYFVYLDTVNTFPNEELTLIQTESYVTDILKEDIYYWKIVFSLYYEGTFFESEIRSFSIQPSTDLVILLQPENGATDVPLDVTLEWQAATDLEGSLVTYDVLIDTAHIPVNVAASGISELSYQPVVASGTTYYWQVIGKDELGGTTLSVVLSFTTENHAPSAFVLTSPANGAISVNTGVTLEWEAATDPDGDAVTYDVLLMEADNPPAKVVASGITETTFAPTLEPETTYIWQVSCYDWHDERTQSEQWSFTTKNNVVVITQPEDGATDVPLDVTLEWQAAADLEGDAVTYDVLLDTNPTPVTVVASGIAELSYQPVVVSGTTYYWQVIGEDELGGTSASAILSFTTINATSNEVILLSPVNNASDVPVSTEMTWELSFDPGTAFYEFDLYIDTNDPPTTMVATHLSMPSFWPTLASGTSYYWKVIGKDYINGATVESPIWNFTTEGGSSTGSIQDIRDGQVYETETIGEQNWMARNLAYLPALSDSIKVYGYEGTDINEAKATENYEKYGALYSWQAAMDGAGESSSNPSGVQGVCPTGWHLPSVREWNELKDFIVGEGNTETGTALKATEGWDYDGNGTDLYGFSGLPSGQYYAGQFTQLGLYGFWWSTVEYYNDNGVPIVWYRSLAYNGAYIGSGSVNTSRALWSVRCLKDD